MKPEELIELIEDFKKHISFLEAENENLAEKLIYSGNGLSIGNENTNTNDFIKNFHFNQDQLSEFTYILIKNIEAKKLNEMFTRENLLSSFYVSVDDDKEIPIKLANKIISIMKL